MLVRGEVADVDFFEESKKGCEFSSIFVAMVIEDDARAPLFLPACYRAIHVAFCAVGGFLEDKVFGRGGESASLRFVFSSLRCVGVPEPCHGIQGFCFDVIFACEIVETSHGREVS